MSADGPRVQVLLFAALGERAGRRRVSLTLTPGARGGRCVAGARPGGAVPEGLRYAVNTEWVGPDHPLEAGDTVALITPVSGG